VGSRSKARARAQASAVAGQARAQAGAVAGQARAQAGAVAGQARGQAGAVAGEQQQGRPLTIALAALVQAIQALGILLAAALAGVAAIQGKAYENASGIAITAIGVGAAIVLGYVALGLSRARRWSRTPALLTQLFTGIVGIYLVQGQRYSWGVPALVLCVAGFILLLVPPSIRALTSHGTDPGGQSGQSSPVSPSRS
jgi:hypothetical protein